MPPWYDGHETCYDGIDHDDCYGCQCPCHDEDDEDEL